LTRSTILDEFLMYFCSVHPKLSEKNKNRQPIRAAVFTPPVETYLVSFLATHRRELSFSIKGTFALHCQVARLVSESFLMRIRNISI
jgi:hypothetical protein